MANDTKWTDDYWLLLMQVYLRKPVGVKPTYSRGMVELGMELHIHPEILAAKMRYMADVPTPRMERIVATYSENPRRLARAVRLLREMKGFNNASEFYDGVETNETFEKDFKPVAEGTELTPVMLTLILDLYFRLTPITMVAETPEVADMAKLIRQKPQAVADALAVFQRCDPYLNRKNATSSPLLHACRKLWNKYATGDIDILVQQAERLREYFK